MSPRLLFLLNTRNAPSWRRSGGSPRGHLGPDWIDAQAAAAQMPGRRRLTPGVQPARARWG